MWAIARFAKHGVWRSIVPPLFCYSFDCDPKSRISDFSSSENILKADDEIYENNINFGKEEEGDCVYSIRDLLLARRLAIASSRSLCIQPPLLCYSIDSNAGAFDFRPQNRNDGVATPTISDNFPPEKITNNSNFGDTKPVSHQRAAFLHQQYHEKPRNICDFGNNDNNNNVVDMVSAFFGWPENFSRLSDFDDFSSLPSSKLGVVSLTSSQSAENLAKTQNFGTTKFENDEINRQASQKAKMAFESAAVFGDAEAGLLSPVAHFNFSKPDFSKDHNIIIAENFKKHVYFDSRFKSGQPEPENLNNSSKSNIPKNLIYSKFGENNNINGDSPHARAAANFRKKFQEKAEIDRFFDDIDLNNIEEIDVKKIPSRAEPRVEDKKTSGFGRPSVLGFKNFQFLYKILEF